MNVLIDENLTPTMVERLAAKGVVAVHVAHIGMPGATDPEVWRYAYEHDQIAVTLNAADFLELAGGVELHPGLVVLRGAVGLSRDQQWAWVEPAIDHLLATGNTLVNRAVLVTGPGKFTDRVARRSTHEQTQSHRRTTMRRLVVHEFMTLDGVMQAPGGKDEDLDGGFRHGGWTLPYWHDDIGKTFFGLMQGVDAFLLGRKTYVTHAAAFEPMPPGDPFGDLMNAPRKYVVSRTLAKPTWRDTTIIREDAAGAARALKAQPGGTILTDGSSQLVHALLAADLVDELHLALYPLALGSGKRVLPADVYATFTLASATPYPSGVVGLHYTRRR